MTERTISAQRIGIVGAGLSGIACARKLAEQGFDCVMYDRGRSLGGRLSTRQIEFEGELYRFNHGAPFLHVRSPAFREIVDKWVKQGFARWDDARSCIRGIPTTQSIPEHLAAGLNIRSSETVISLERAGSQWEVHSLSYADSESHIERFDAVVFACPFVQAQRVLHASKIQLTNQLQEISSSTTWILMLILEHETGFDSLPDFYRFEQAGDVQQIVVQSRQADRVALVATMSPAWSSEHSGSRADEVHESMNESAKNAIATLAEIKLGSLRVLYTKPHRWGLARSRSVIPEAFNLNQSLRLGFAGDSFAGPDGIWLDAEGAYLSGNALGSAVSLQTRS